MLRSPKLSIACLQAVSQRPITILMWAPALLRDVKGIYNGACPDTLPANDDIKATYFNTYGLGENHEVAGRCSSILRGHAACKSPMHCAAYGRDACWPPAAVFL